MYNFSRYQAKELALAYMSGKAAQLSLVEFLQAVKQAERNFDYLLKHGEEENRHLTVKSF